MYHYVYYSYEEWGRGYIGRRSCECLPEEDLYLGSFRDNTFRPTRKIVLSTFSSREDAAQAEVILHEFYQVHINPHFANKAKQSSKKFYNNLTKEQRERQSSLVTKINLRETNVFRRKGEESVSHGRVWVTNADRSEEVYLKPGEKVPEGWIRGRKKFAPRTEGSKAKTSQALKGKRKTKEHREKLRQATIEWYRKNSTGKTKQD